MITFKQLAEAILALPEDQQDMMAFVEDDSRLFFVQDPPLKRLYRDRNGYNFVCEPGDDLSHVPKEDLLGLTEVLVIDSHD